MMDLRDLESAPVEEKPELMVSVDDNGYVKLRWTETFGDRDDRIFEDLEKVFREIPGVEYSKLKRYSASLEIAEHVFTPHDMVRLLPGVLGKYFRILDISKGRTK